MLQIEYNFFNNNNENIVNADEMTLRYNLFLGSILLKDENKSLMIDWDLIPILDFALCLLKITDNLSQIDKGDEIFDFTESDAKLFFQKDTYNIKITSSFSNEIFEVSFLDFHECIREFYRKIVFELSNKYEELKINVVFIGYLKIAEKII